MLELIREDNSVKPFVRFERIPVENKVRSLEEGRYVAVDVDYVNVTPPFSKDIFKQKAAAWFEQLERDVQNNRISEAWVLDYKKAYEYWKRGQELPLEGTPIKGWGVISPAQQETLIRMNVLTVEVLAKINDEGIRRIGMGGIDLKNKASAWLKTLGKSGAATLEIAALKKENESLKASLAILESRIDKISKLEPAVNNVVSITDLLDDDDTVITD